MSEMKIIIEGSGKHCHVTQQTLDILFGPGFEMEKKKMLSQPGQFATPHKVTIIGPKGETKLSILGPCRKQDQVELSFTDCRPLGIDAPCRMSGDLKGSASCTMVGPKGTVELKEGVIVAMRHCHISPEDGEKWGIKDGDPLLVTCGGNGDRPLVFDGVKARVGEGHATFMHIDYDELNAAGLFEENPIGIITKK